MLDFRAALTLLWDAACSTIPGASAGDVRERFF
jgi:hypothetical protein